MQKPKNPANIIKEKKVAIIGGGPSALFLLQEIIAQKAHHLSLTIFESSANLGYGFPYSDSGANKEHITNVSANEIPKMVTSVKEWIDVAPKSILKSFDINSKNFNEYKVMPRLFFGHYLNAQFKLLLKQAKLEKIKVTIFLQTKVEDVFDQPNEQQIKIKLADHELVFDHVVICTGHRWPKKHEGKINNYFDSPYPPAKLKQKANHSVAITGASLTAIDAIRTLARSNGKFTHHKNGDYTFQLSDKSKHFKLALHCLDGLLPALRFHLKNPRLQNQSLLTEKQIKNHLAKNNGFIDLDYIFDKDFKEIIKKEDHNFYQTIKHDNLESFVAKMLAYRMDKDPIELFSAEYEQAEKSIAKHQSIYWKEALAMLSFSMNYPAKYFSAEDMLRLQKHLMPLIAVVIAFVPQSSAREFLALHDAGVLEIINVDKSSKVVPQKKGGANYLYKVNGKTKRIYYPTYVNAIGQPHFTYQDFIFKGLIKSRTLSKATLPFKSASAAKAYAKENPDKIKKTKKGDLEMIVTGIKINDFFQAVNENDQVNERIFIMAVPYIGGYNPDYSGLDFSEAASKKIVKGLLC